MSLQPVESWFEAQGWRPFPFQREVWQAYLDGESGLIHSPTGSGKTYAAFLGAVLEWLAAHPASASGTVKRALTAPFQILWITPLRALSVDTAKNLQAVIDYFGLPWSLETRTGDTSSAVRSRQTKRLPTVLITTPESFSLFLSRANAQELFESVNLVVVDEWHELMSSKRGTQTELGLARLRRWQPTLRVWGLSATLGNLDVALRALLGMADMHTGEVTTGSLIQGDMSKPIVIDSIIPKTMERFPWAGHLGLKLLPQVIQTVEESQTTLIFTNTRFQTESWFQAILDARPDWAGIVALHHSSLDPKTRDWVEEGLRTAKLKCVVCTSSLDLGVDFPTVDRVLQVGSPKGVARLLQRAGRSGHRPEAVSYVTCVPSHALELVEVAAARWGVENHHIETRPPVDKPLDVLVQHLVTLALGGGFQDDLYDEVRTTYAYRHLTRSEWEWALQFVSSGGQALRAYPQYNRVEQQDGFFRVVADETARIHRLSIGTIMQDASLRVKYLKGPEVGRIDESFVSRLKPGDKFTLGGKVLRFLHIHDMDVIVRRDTGSKGVVPHWYGGKLPLSAELTEAMRLLLHSVSVPSQAAQSPEIEALRPILDLQRQWSAVPLTDQLLIEQVKTREGHHLFFYPLEGRLVHEGMATLVAYRFSRYQPITFTLAFNDYGFELLSPDQPPLEQALADGLFSTDHLLDDIQAAMNASEMARRHFREIARISGLVIERFPGGNKSARQLQTSSGLIYDVLHQYDPDNLLLRQVEREILEKQLEQLRLTSTLQRITSGQVVITTPHRPTPFSFPLLVDRLRQTVSSETLEDRIRRLVESYEKMADV